MMSALVSEHGGDKAVMIDATDLKAHRTVTRMAAKKGAWSSNWSDPRRH